MKKLSLIIVAVLILSVLPSCGSDKDVIGAWYSTKPDVLIIKEDGVYTSNWLTSNFKGNYTIDGDLIIFTSPDGEAYEFEIVQDGNQKTLHYKKRATDSRYIYYSNKDLVDKLIVEQEERAKKEEAEKAEASKKETAEILVGTWSWVGFSSTIEFTEDGKYLWKNWEEHVWDYEVIDAETIKITPEDGKSYDQRVKISKTDNGYELSFYGNRYIKN